MTVLNGSPQSPTVPYSSLHCLPVPYDIPQGPTRSSPKFPPVPLHSLQFLLFLTVLSCSPQFSPRSLQFPTVPQFPMVPCIASQFPTTLGSPAQVPQTT